MRELWIEGEIFGDGETILDVLRRNLRGDKVPRYLSPHYNNPGYLSDDPYCR